MPRIQIPSGGWWDIKEQITHGDWRAVEKQAQRQALAMMSEFKQAGVDLNDLIATNHNGEETPLSAGQEDALLERATVAWSFPEPVTAAASYALRNEQDVQVVLTAMRAQYQLQSRALRSSEGKGLSGASLFSRTSN